MIKRNKKNCIKNKITQVSDDLQMNWNQQIRSTQNKGKEQRFMDFLFYLSKKLLFLYS